MTLRRILGIDNGTKGDTEHSQLMCEKCNKYDNTVKLQPKVWNNYNQDYLEAFICDKCLVKWGPRPVK